MFQFLDLLNPQKNTSNPNFYFKGTDKPAAPGKTNWQFVGGRTPIPTPKVQLPQNFNPLSGFSVYGDRQGNHWYENDQTGQKIPIPLPKQPIDSPIQKQYPGPPKATVPVQYRHQRKIMLDGILV